MGLRRGEINGLKYSDVDYINRTLKIQRQLGKKPNSKAEDVPPKMLTKQEIKPKTPSSIRETMCLRQFWNSAGFMRRIAGEGVKSSVTGITFAVPLMEIQEVKAIIRNIIKNCLLL